MLKRATNFLDNNFIKEINEDYFEYKNVNDWP